MTLVFDEINLMELWPVDFCNANRFIPQDFPLPVFYSDDGRRKIWLLFIQLKEKVLHLPILSP
jgi:hypothetical protein